MSNRNQSVKIIFSRDVSYCASWTRKTSISLYTYWHSCLACPNDRTTDGNRDSLLALPLETIYRDPFDAELATLSSLCADGVAHASRPFSFV